MSRYDKLVERLRRRPPLSDFDDLQKILEMNGWVMRRGGKHTAVFTKPGDPRRQVVPTVRGRRVKQYVVDQVLELLNLDE